MATITSAGSGNWSAGATWVGGVAPTSADDAVIAGAHTVTLDTTGLVARTVSVSGVLQASGAASSALTVGIGVTLANVATARYLCDLSASPSITHTLNLNSTNLTAGSAGNLFCQFANPYINLKGYPRKRKTKITTALTAGVSTSVTVEDATGWQVGDTVCFESTSAYAATPLSSSVVLTSVAGNVIGWAAGITNSHAAGAVCGNFTSNVTIQPNTAGQEGFVRVYSTSTFNANCAFDNVAFKDLFSSSNNTALLIEGNFSTAAVPVSVTNCAFFNSRRAAIRTSNLNSELAPISGCVFYADITYSHITWSNVYLFGGAYSLSDIAVIRGNNTYDAVDASGGWAIRAQGSAVLLDGVSVSGSVGGIQTLGVGHEASGDLWIRSCKYGLRSGENSLVSSEFNFADNTYDIVAANAAGTVRIVSPNTTQTSIFNIGNSRNQTSIELVDKNGDVLAQEIYRPFCEIKRDNSVKNRGTSSLSIKPTKLATNSQRAQSIPCANGATIRVVGYVRMDTAYWNAGDNNLPTVTLSGLGATPVTFTASSSANNAWEQFDVSITNSSGNDGNFVLTYTANAKTVSTGTVYFDGVPDSPFVTKVRHYGFLFNETSPTREVNPYTVASESTAAAYTGVTVNATTKRVTFGIGTADTLAKVYDYSQAWAVLNIDKEVPWQRAGALLSLTSGWTVVDPVISGVTWGGGTVAYSTPGNIEASFDTTTLEFTTAGTYSMGDSVFAGTIELTNTSGGAVTVELPSGTSYTNTGPSITVTTPVLYQSVTINGLVTGSRVYIYDTVTATVLANAVASGSSYTWTDSVAASADRNIWLRVAYQSGVSAKRFIDVAIGTCGTTDLTAALTYLVNQEDDTVYITNAIDGSAVTGISIDDAIDRMVISIGGGSGTWPEIYAYQVYWLATSAGIIDDGAFISAPDPANYLLSGFQIRNSSATPLTITGGYGRDADTETVAACIDVAGSVGNIYPAPDHVVPFSTGSGLTAGQAAKLESLDTQAVNVVSIKGQAINGTGTENDPWGP